MRLTTMSSSLAIEERATVATLSYAPQKINTSNRSGPVKALAISLKSCTFFNMIYKIDL